MKRNGLAKVLGIFFTIIILVFSIFFLLDLDFTNNNPTTPISQSNGKTLESLSVMGYSLNPSFDPDIFIYDIVVASDTTSVEVSAKASDKNAQVWGTGTKILEDYVTDCTIIVEAIDGTTNEYTIFIFKDAIAQKSKIDYLLSVLQVPKESYDKNEVDGIIERLLGFDIKLWKKLSEGGVEIRLVNGAITDEPEYNYLKDVVPRGWENTGKTWNDIPGAGGKLTVIRIGHSFPHTFNSHSSIVLELHEVSHTIDQYVFNTISESSEFKKIKNEEKKNLFGNTAYYDINEEYFAEALAMFSYNEDSRTKLKTKAPKTYQFFVDIIEGLN